MNIIQNLALIALMTLIVYFILVKIFYNTVPSSGTIEDKIENLNTEVDKISATTVGLPVGEGVSPNTTTLSVYNENATGILPVNHDLFEKPANFGSDVTNISQFYRNNPELFHKDTTKANVYVPNVTEWDAKGKELFTQQQNLVQGPINPYNYEQDYSPLDL